MPPGFPLPHDPLDHAPPQVREAFDRAMQAGRVIRLTSPTQRECEEAFRPLFYKLRDDICAVMESGRDRMDTLEKASQELAKFRDGPSPEPAPAMDKVPAPLVAPPAADPEHERKRAEERKCEMWRNIRLALTEITPSPQAAAYYEPGEPGRDELLAGDPDHAAWMSPLLQAVMLVRRKPG